jgi:chromosomal replication initiation ATPase DnaA
MSTLPSPHRPSAPTPIKAARFPVYKDLSGFNFASSEANEALVRQLHRCEFIENADNVVLVGGPGTGKSHIATALGVQAVEHHRKKVRFFGTVDLVNALEQEKAQGRSGQIADRLMRCDLVILDELGYLPFSASGGALLFHLLSIRSTKGEDESRTRRICSGHSAAPRTVRTGRPSGAAQTASRRSASDSRGQRRLAPDDRRAKHGACGCPIVDA